MCMSLVISNQIIDEFYWYQMIYDAFCKITRCLSFGSLFNCYLLQIWCWVLQHKLLKINQEENIVTVFSWNVIGLFLCHPVQMISVIFKCWWCQFFRNSARKLWYSGVACIRLMDILEILWHFSMKGVCDIFVDLTNTLLKFYH